jgi:hypothetical protein
VEWNRGRAISGTESAPVTAQALGRGPARSGCSVGTTHERRVSGPVTGPAKSTPLGLATTRMAARPSSCLQQLPLHPRSPERRSVYTRLRRRQSNPSCSIPIAARSRQSATTRNKTARVARCGTEPGACDHIHPSRRKAPTIKYIPSTTTNTPNARRRYGPETRFAITAPSQPPTNTATAMIIAARTLTLS